MDESDPNNNTNDNDHNDKNKNDHNHLDSEIDNIQDWEVFCDFTKTKLSEAISKIQQFWEALGLDGEGAIIRRQNFAIQFKEFVDKYIDNERLHNHFVQKSVLDVAAQLEEMANALSYSMPIISDVSKKPLELLEELNRLMVDLSSEKNDRILRYNELTIKIRELCTVLDQHESIPKLNSFTKRFNGVENHKSKYIPSNEEIDVLNTYLNNLTNEINERKFELENIRGSILDILALMGRNSQDPKYVPLFSSKHQNLSRSFIDTIQRFHDELMDENNHCKLKYDSLWKEIEYWWEKLDTEPLERDVLRARHRKNHGYESIKTLESIKENIIKERLSRIGQCVEKQRKLLKNTLKNSYAFYNRRNADLFGGEEVLDLANTKFDPKDVVMNTEAYLVRLETAVDVANQYYNDNATLFTMIQRREQLWSELCTFESTPLTSDRLKNRGGILLKEEKIRKRIYKELPTVQQQLAIVIMDWQNKYNIDSCNNGAKTRIFYWEDGSDYTELLRHQWETRINLNKKLNHPDESINYKFAKTTMLTPIKKAGVDKCFPSPRTPLSSASSYTSNSARRTAAKVSKRAAATPSTFLRSTATRNTPFGGSSNRVKTPQRHDIILPKVPKLTFSSPIVENENKAPLLPLPNISINENIAGVNGNKSKTLKKNTPLKKPQLN